MGQTIEINGQVTMGNVLVIDINRSLGGQEGAAFESLEEAEARAESARPAAAFPARLAMRLFGADPAINHVFVMSNVVSIGRSEPWDDRSIARASTLVADFFIFYGDQ